MRKKNPKSNRNITLLTGEQKKEKISLTSNPRILIIKVTSDKCIGLFSKTKVFKIRNEDYDYLQKNINDFNAQTTKEATIELTLSDK